MDFSLMPEDWQKLLLSMGEKPFRGKQIFEWLHAKGAVSYDQMTNLSIGLRNAFRRRCRSIWCGSVLCRSRRRMIRRSS